MVFRLLFLCIVLQAPMFADVWGKDADLASPAVKKDEKARSLAGAESIISFHQKVLSLADGPRSHFYPSSSSYMLSSMKKYGLLQGYFLGCDRLMRENSDPWLYGYMRTKDGDYLKWDPVP